MNEKYYSLHNHTASSNARLIDCINKVEDLIQYAFELGLSGIAITDHETVNAHIKAIKYVEKKRAKDEAWKDFKLILGNEIYLCRNNLNSTNYDSKKDKFYHFILLAVDEIGHEQIRQLSTRAYEHSFMKNRMRRVPTYYSDLEEIIGSNPGHVIASSACLGGYLGTKILAASAHIVKYPDYYDSEIENLKEWIKYIQSIFGKENFYLELQPSDTDEQIFVNEQLIKLSNELSVKAIVTTDSHYQSKEDREFHKAYLNSKEGDREVDAFYATTYLMSSEEIHEYMDKYNTHEIVSSLLENTCEIGLRIQDYDIRKPFKLPYLPNDRDMELAKLTIFDLPYDKINPEIWNKFINSPEDSDRVFIQKIINRCNVDRKYYWTKDRIDRMEVELETVWNASQKQNITWTKYFLQVSDYIDIAWTEGDTIVGPGRGSGVGFYLNYLLDIIQIDPMVEKVPLFFWRFLNPERASILD